MLRNTTCLRHFRHSNVRLLNNPFIDTEAEIVKIDRTTSGKRNFNLQKPVIKYAKYKDYFDPNKKAYGLYDKLEDGILPDEMILEPVTKRYDPTTSPLKSKKHYRKYQNWQEAEPGVLFRELPGIVPQKEFFNYTGTKSRKHLDTHMMFDKTMLGKIANQIPYVKGKHVIEFYPTFGLLSTRLLKKEPLSYTFVEPDKRVIKSLERLAQAAKDNDIGVRLIRTEPLKENFQKLHFEQKYRDTLTHFNKIKTVKDPSNTVVVANCPFWATNYFLQRLCDEYVDRGAQGQTVGLFRAGAVPIYLNTSAAQGAALLGKMSKLGKLVDNFFEITEIQLVEGQHYTPKCKIDTLWIMLKPRPEPLLDLKLTDLEKLINIYWNDRDNMFAPRPGQPSIGHTFIDRMKFIAEVGIQDDNGNKIEGLHPGDVAKAVIKLAGVDTWKTMESLDMKDIGDITAVVLRFSESSYDNIHREVRDMQKFMTEEHDIEKIMNKMESAKRLTDVDSMKQRLNEYHDQLNEKFGLPKKNMLRRERLDLTIDDTSEMQWEMKGQNSIRNAYKELQQRDKQINKKTSKKKERFGRKPPHRF